MNFAKAVSVHHMRFSFTGTVKPFRLWFHTDNVEAPVDVGNRGFCLNYIQQPCTNNVI